MPTPSLNATGLSTILDSDSSGISKHLPSLDTSQAESAFHLSSNAVQPQALHPPPHDTQRGSSSAPHDYPALEILTSHFKDAALPESPGKKE